MNYNVYISDYSGSFNILDIDGEKLQIIIDSYKNGEGNFTISGKTYSISKVNEFRIFENIYGANQSELMSVAAGKKLVTRTYFGNIYLSPIALSKFGNEVTEQRIGNISYGQLKPLPKVKTVDTVFIDLSRIDELRNIKSSEFDLLKLIKLCDELNFNFAAANYLSAGMIVRAIIDHVPPIFKHKTFNEVANNYSGGGSSFKKNATHLNESLRSIADSFLHIHIRKSETLPTIIQVDFKQNIDVLLAEIVRILK